MRSLLKPLSLIFLPLFIFIYLVVTPISHAVNPNIFGIVGVKTMQDYGKEFCDKRSGDLMNLETWFSGKCAPGVDTLSGEGVGFVDIIILQGMEWVNTLTFSSPSDTFIDSIAHAIAFIKGIYDYVKANPITDSTSLNDIAFVSIPNNSGTIGSLNRLLAGLSTVRPASSIDYVNYIARNLQKHQVISETYAAGPGYGFTALSPILPLWRAFRNIAYMLFAMGFVLYGIMIMFRVRIDSKTAATIQLAIPKLIATLLMITFSYAIVGFLVDISTIANAMAINILKAGDIIHPVNDFVPNVAAGRTIFGAIGSFILNAFLTLIVSPFLFFNLIIGGIAGIIVAVIASAVSIVSGIGIIIGIILLIAVAVAYFKLIVKLFQAFFSIIINLIFAPIILLGNLLPGSTSFGDWLRSIYGNLAVFPVAIFFLTLSYALLCQPILTIIPGVMQAATGTTGQILAAVGLSVGDMTQSFLEALLGVKALSTLSNIWTPPMTVPGGGTVLTAGGGSAGTAFGSVGSLMLGTIGFGLLLMASKYCEMVEKALKTPPFPYGAAIGEALTMGRKGNEWVASQGYFGMKAPTGKPLSNLYGPSAPGQKPTVFKTPGGINLGP